MVDVYGFSEVFCLYFRDVVYYFDFFVVIFFYIVEDEIWGIYDLVLVGVDGICVVVLVEDVFVGVGE